jgi:hypothetical protein
MGKTYPGVNLTADYVTTAQDNWILEKPMEGRTVGSGVLYALDSDQTRLSPQMATLLRAGVAAAPAAGEARTAALAHIPAHAAGHIRGSLFALAEEDGPGTYPSAMPAVRSLAESFYSSLCHTGGHALDSAVGASLEHLRSLTCRGYNLPGVGLAVAAMQERHLWVTTTAACGAYLLRLPAGDWLPLTGNPSLAPDSPPCGRPPVYTRPDTAIALEMGDLLVLSSQGLQARLPERMLKTCLLALLRGDPTIAPQDLAEIVVRLAESRPGPGEAAALVVRCYGVLPTREAATQGWPAAYRLAAVIPAQDRWDGPALALPTGAPARVANRVTLDAADPRAAPCPPVRSEMPQSAPGAGQKPKLTPALRSGPVLAPRAEAKLHNPVPVPLNAWRPQWATVVPATWVGAAPRLAQVLLPGAGVLVGGGLISSWLSNNMVYMLGGCSLSGLLLCAAVWPEQARAGHDVPALVAPRPTPDPARAGTGWARARAYVPPPRPVS